MEHNETICICISISIGLQIYVQNLYSTLTWSRHGLNWKGYLPLGIYEHWKCVSMVCEFWLGEFLNLSYITPDHNWSQLEMRSGLGLFFPSYCYYFLLVSMAIYSNEFCRVWHWLRSLYLHIYKIESYSHLSLCEYYSRMSLQNSVISMEKNSDRMKPW